ncbi:hypothetical protein C0Q70_16038 [Pomacea canaliculata]|uniref:Elongation of very long chain fatty acids protein n=1 Tax=Pomacea canaliculata TaxID=400727 RepID=A0A2T7NNR0_POMCA|nr:hypothetical protein C0Q70_16038 [Pomacea canaliculata]
MKLCFSLSLTPFRTTDPHASDFPLMGGGESMAAVVVLYLLTATQGPRLMSMCKPFQLNLLLIVYNFFMVVLSVYMFTVGAYLTIATDHSFVCTTVEEAHSKGHSALAQFVILLAFTLVNIVAECDFPKGFSYAALVYGLTYLLLFINFYRRSFSSKDKGQ